MLQPFPVFLAATKWTAPLPQAPGTMMPCSKSFPLHVVSLWHLSLAEEDSLRVSSLRSPQRDCRGDWLRALATLPRTQIQLPGSTQQLTSVWNSSSKESNTFIQTYMEAKHQCTGKLNAPRKAINPSHIGRAWQSQPRVVV